MTKSEHKREVSLRLLMVESYRTAKARTHKIFATVQEVADYHNISQKYLWKLSVKLTENDDSPLRLLPMKPGAKHPHNKFPKALERIIVSLRNRLGWSSYCAGRKGWLER